MKKIAQTPEEVNRLLEQTKGNITERLNLSLQQMQNIMSDETISQAEKNSRISQIVQNLSRDIGSEIDKVKEMVNSMPRIESPAIDDKSASKREKKKVRHLSPRDTRDNKKLPAFWRKNYDYGESPYMHMDKIEKITDKPQKSKKKKRRK